MTEMPDEEIEKRVKAEVEARLKQQQAQQQAAQPKPTFSERVSNAKGRWDNWRAERQQKSDIKKAQKQQIKEERRQAALNRKFDGTWVGMFGLLAIIFYILRHILTNSAYGSNLWTLTMDFILLFIGIRIFAPEEGFTIFEKGFYAMAIVAIVSHYLTFLPFGLAQYLDLLGPFGVLLVWNALIRSEGHPELNRIVTFFTIQISIPIVFHHLDFLLEPLVDSVGGQKELIYVIPFLILYWPYWLHYAYSHTTEGGSRGILFLNVMGMILLILVPMIFVGIHKFVPIEGFVANLEQSPINKQIMDNGVANLKSAADTGWAHVMCLVEDGPRIVQISTSNEQSCWEKLKDKGELRDNSALISVKPGTFQASQVISADAQTFTMLQQVALTNRRDEELEVDFACGVAPVADVQFIYDTRDFIGLSKPSRYTLAKSLQPKELALTCEIPEAPDPRKPWLVYRSTINTVLTRTTLYRYFTEEYDPDSNLYRSEISATFPYGDYEANKGRSFADINLRMIQGENNGVIEIDRAFGNTEAQEIPLVISIVNNDDGVIVPKTFEVTVWPQLSVTSCSNNDKHILSRPKTADGTVIRFDTSKLNLEHLKKGELEIITTCRVIFDPPQDSLSPSQRQRVTVPQLQEFAGRMTYDYKVYAFQAIKTRRARASPRETATNTPDRGGLTS